MQQTRELQTQSDFFEDEMITPPIDGKRHPHLIEPRPGGDLNYLRRGWGEVGVQNDYPISLENYKRAKKTQKSGV